MSMNLIGSVPYLEQVEGFRDGAAAKPNRPDAGSDYETGYLDGQKARENYIQWLNANAQSLLFNHPIPPPPQPGTEVVSFKDKA